MANYPRYFHTYDMQIAPRVNQAILLSERGMWQKRIISTSFCKGLSTLMWRDFVNIKRNPMLLLTRVLQTLVISLIGGAVFWQLSNDYSDTSLSSKSFVSKNGALFFLAAPTFVTSFASVVATFPV